MANEKINLRDELRAHKFEFGVLKRVPCTKQENKEYAKLLKDGETLPEGVYAYDYDLSAFYTVCGTDLTENEIREYLTYKQLGFIRTIKNCVVFFTTLSIIGLVISFLSILSAL